MKSYRCDQCYRQTMVQKVRGLALVNQGSSSMASVPLPTLQVDCSGGLRHGRSQVPTQNRIYRSQWTNPKHLVVWVVYCKSYIFVKVASILRNPGVYGAIIPAPRPKSGFWSKFEAVLLHIWSACPPDLPILLVIASMASMVLAILSEPKVRYDTIRTHRTFSVGFGVVQKAHMSLDYREIASIFSTQSHM